MNITGKEEIHIIYDGDIHVGQAQSHERCVIFAIHISSEKGKEVEDEEVLKKDLYLQQFQDVFLKNILYFLPHKEVEFSIESVPWATLV